MNKWKHGHSDGHVDNTNFFSVRVFKMLDNPLKYKISACQCSVCNTKVNHKELHIISHTVY